MRKTLAILLALVLALALCACGITKENVPLKYGETYTVEPESLENFDTLVWTSADEAVATVDGGKIKAVGPGSAVVTAADAEGKAVAEYTVEVEIVPVTSIVLSTNTCEVAEGESFQLNYTLFPDDASDYGLNWKSADESVAKVSADGKITGVAVGQTTISISNKEGFMATCSVTVKKALPNFKELYGKWENERWFTVSDDGTWMKFDTNPKNDDGDNIWAFYTDYLAVDENLPVVLTDLGFNSSVYEKMGHTTALMGRQETSNDICTVSWTYHPDKGLEVLIEVNG